mgnify:CR=1 FL=1
MFSLPVILTYQKLEVHCETGVSVTHAQVTHDEGERSTKLETNVA